MAAGMATPTPPAIHAAARYSASLVSVLRAKRAPRSAGGAPASRSMAFCTDEPLLQADDERVDDDHRHHQHEARQEQRVIAVGVNCRLAEVGRDERGERLAAARQAVW